MASSHLDRAYDNYCQTKHFSSLNGLRCIAILLVIWFHTASTATAGTPSEWGHHGVTLFFALSGFLITTLLLREKRQFGTISLGMFYIRRAQRILPLYYLVLAIYIVAVLLLESGTADGAEFFANLLAYATFTSNWFVDLDGRVIFYFAWSLATEEQFYLVWPWFERLLKPKAALLTMTAFLSAVLLYSQTRPGFMAGSFAETIVLSIMPAICLGVILAHLLDIKSTFRWTYRVLSFRGSSLCYGLLLVAVLSFDLPILSLAHNGIAVHLLCAMWVGSCVCREDHVLAGLLRWRPAQWIGLISYGMYLLHMLGFNALKVALPGHEAWPDFLVFAAVTVITTAMASVSYLTFESHFLRIKARYYPTPASRPAFSAP